MNNAARRPVLYFDKEQQHNRKISIPGAIRTHNLSRRVAADLRLTPHRLWDWPCQVYRHRK